MSTISQTSIVLKGRAIPGATDRQEHIAGFDQAVFSSAHVVCIGAGGLVSHIAPTLARKGIGKLTILDDDVVEASNLNRQFFYSGDIGRSKAISLATNLQKECIYPTVITARPLSLQQAIESKLDLSCSIAVCGVDNDTARCIASARFRTLGIPVIFCGVSRDGSHGYVFIQRSRGACFGCAFPDASGDGRMPCPAAPSIAEILQLVGSLVCYAIDVSLMGRQCSWDLRDIYLQSNEWDTCHKVDERLHCEVCVIH
jgi:molybdopterin/thiamine biosynthesis adenylyltransferase